VANLWSSTLAIGAPISPPTNTRSAGNWLAWLRPERTVPVTRWRAPSRWRPSLPTFGVLIAGLWFFGTGEALIINAGLGVSPWTVLAQGITSRTGLAIGLTTFITGCFVLLLWIPLRERPGLGTIANIIVISAAIEVMTIVIPNPQNFVVQLLCVLAGIACIGIGSGLYLTTNLGPGPRDGWMTGIHLRTGWPVPVVRTSIEVLVLGTGWLLGGTVGLGTLLFAALVGTSVGYGLMLARRLGEQPGAQEQVVDEAVFPELEA